MIDELKKEFKKDPGSVIFPGIMMFCMATGLLGFIFMIVVHLVKNS